MTLQPAKIAIVDSGVANLASVMAAVQRVGRDAEITADTETIRAAGHVILPGVGAASDRMRERMGPLNALA
jgi:glutamine amidotransferase